MINKTALIIVICAVVLMLAGIIILQVKNRRR